MTQRFVVFDNAEDPREIRPYVPRDGTSQVIITTTRRSFTRFSRATVIDVGGFTHEEAIAHLTARTSLRDPAGEFEGYVEVGGPR